MRQNLQKLINSLLGDNQKMDVAKQVDYFFWGENLLYSGVLLLNIQTK